MQRFATSVQHRREAPSAEKETAGRIAPGE
jgi:hypothetical protein